MSAFLTDSDNPQIARPKAGSGYVDFKEEVCATLQRFGIPLRPAEIAVIDFRPEVIGYFQQKNTPAEAAVLMVDKIRRIYKVG